MPRTSRILFISGLIAVVLLFISFVVWQVQKQNSWYAQYRYIHLVSSLQQLVIDHDAAHAMAYLEKEIEKDPLIADTCHPLVHTIGRAAFAKYGFTQALNMEYDLCGSGYIHGVIETYLEQVDDLPSTIKTICEPNAPKCFHGIGHGLMVRSFNNLPESLEYCHTFPQKFQWVQCSEGVFMENFQAHEEHPSEYFKAEDVYYPCRGRDPVDEGVCAFYAARAFLAQKRDAYAEAFAFCQSIPEGPRDACFKGVGDGVMKHHISDPLFAEQVCALGPKTAHQYCIQGMTSYYIVHFASSKKGAELCTLLQENSRPFCETMAKESKKAYPH